ncbi:putative aldouronate transport system permease protein [Paenibacillus sp. 1_12]|uniref:carbohydrate ABC transporter permease n=1 Tax=Paenibacillus sp. 1_12 TaxID=1566278 RepID=UPI0008DF018D|nr:carbohydrate ABC transporter permease [Paenibacillus sp. 1_12]SFL56416.1 putative aldouronate transport system permease protein [Paenibacillus sp. 1_12]
MSLVQKKGLTLFDYINYGLLLIISTVCMLPFIYVVSVSLTDASVYEPYKFYIFPEKFSLAAYSYILATKSFKHALTNTVFITVVGTILNLLFTFTMAYGLTKKTLPHRKFIIGIVVFTLVFQAGIVPNYLLIKQLGLLNSHWALIWSAMISSFNLIVVKSFFDSLPSELEDSARMDGCNEVGVFLRIVLPLSMPAVAAFTLFFAVSHWNTYFNALIYLSDAKKWTLQVLVKNLIMDANANSVDGVMPEDIVLPVESIRLASVVIAILPILVIYPFLQKHFAKGVLLGSVKG